VEEKVATAFGKGVEKNTSLIKRVLSHLDTTVNPELASLREEMREVWELLAQNGSTA